MPAFTLAIPPKITNAAGGLNGFPHHQRHTHIKKIQNQNFTTHVKQCAGIYIQLNDLILP